MTVLHEVATGILVATSRTMSTTSTVIVGSDSTALLVDPAWLPDELDDLGQDLDRRGLRVIGGFSTHAHHDHLLWHPRFGDVPRWASHITAALAVGERPALLEHLGSDFPADLTDLMGRVDGCAETVPDESRPAGVEIELVVHNGHAPGHSAVWLPQARVLLAGDMLSDLELPLPFYPDDLPAYLHALKVLAPYVARAAVLVPGHGTVTTDPQARWDADHRYLSMLQRHGDADDSRRTLPGMDEAHAHLRKLARGSGAA